LGYNFEEVAVIYVFKKKSAENEMYGFSFDFQDDWVCYKTISKAEYDQLFEGQSKGKRILFKDDATPYLAEPEPQKTEREKFDDGLISKEEYNAFIDRQRQAAYRQETDPLGMQVMRGELDKSEWLAKINEIKRRYPKVK
jgi:hypothetical protein